MPSCTYDDFDNFTDMIGEFDKIFYKSLSTNDHEWVIKKNKHQSGFLIPRRFLNFFTGINEYPEENSHYEINISWLLDGNSYKRSDMETTYGKNTTTVRYYCEGNRKTRPETHLTNVYNPYFEDLTDGCYVVIGRTTNKKGFKFVAIIIDNEDIINSFFSVFDIPDGSIWDVITFDNSIDYASKTEEEIDLFQILIHIAEQKYSELGKLPSTKYTSDIVWDTLRKHENLIPGHFKCPGIYRSSSPFYTAAKNTPGNLTRWMLQTVEFNFVKELEKLHYPKQYINQLKHEDYPNDWSALERLFAEKLNKIIKTTKSLTQSRRSRAGKSFEWHIFNLLQQYEVEIDRQASDRKVDFLLHHKGEEIILSAKTSLRERWKQVYEGSYFITLDRNISENKLENIKDRNIKLVVPENDKSKLDKYSDDKYILDFKTFFQKFPIKK